MRNSTILAASGEPRSGALWLCLHGRVTRCQWFAVSSGAVLCTIWTSLDPVEAINRYEYVRGNSINLTDSTGLCPDRNLCGELQLQGNIDAYKAVGCSSRKACCGYDVTAWFVQELWIHGNFAERALASSRSIPILPWLLGGFIEPLVDTGIVSFSLADYAAAIPHKWMNFAVGNSDCPSGADCTRSVTLCGKCIDRSELGNILFGYAGGKLALNQDFILFGGRVVAQGMRGEAERATVGIGIHLSSQAIDTVKDLCREVKVPKNHSFMGTDSYWDWDLANVGQQPDVSKCMPCTELLPSNYPHTVPSMDQLRAGISQWTDNSIVNNETESKEFFITQIPDIRYLSPELCLGLDRDRRNCGISILGG